MLYFLPFHPWLKVVGCLDNSAQSRRTQETSLTFTLLTFALAAQLSWWGCGTLAGTWWGVAHHSFLRHLKVLSFSSLWILKAVFGGSRLPGTIILTCDFLGVSKLSLFIDPVYSCSSPSCRGPILLLIFCATTHGLRTLETGFPCARARAQHPVLSSCHYLSKLPHAAKTS